MTEPSGPRSEIAPVLAGDLIRYSQVWEDHRLLEVGLDIGPEDDVLSITSAGDNVLALLLCEPRSVTAIDLNPAQTHLLQLKLAALRVLDHAQLVCLLGFAGGMDRRALLAQVEPALPSESVAFWRAHAELVEVGLAGSGRLERYIHGFHEQLYQLVDRAAVQQLLALADVATQRALFAQTLGRPEVERAFRWYFGREMMARQGRDPAQFKYVREGDVGGYFFDRFRYACTELPLADNFYLASFLLGRYRDFASGPAYLRPHNADRLRGLVDRVDVVTGELEQHVGARPPGSYSKLNLSDIFEYMSADAAAQLLGALARWLRPGARIAYWNLLVPRSSNAAQHPRLTPLADQAHDLWKRDRSWFYRAFHLEKVEAP